MTTDVQKGIPSPEKAIFRPTVTKFNDTCELVIMELRAGEQ